MRPKVPLIYCQRLLKGYPSSGQAIKLSDSIQTPEIESFEINNECLGILNLKIKRKVTQLKSITVVQLNFLIESENNELLALNRVHF